MLLLPTRDVYNKSTVPETWNWTQQIYWKSTEVWDFSLMNVWSSARISEFYCLWLTSSVSGFQFLEWSCSTFFSVCSFHLLKYWAVIGQFQENWVLIGQLHEKWLNTMFWLVTFAAHKWILQLQKHFIIAIIFCAQRILLKHVANVKNSKNCVLKRFFVKRKLWRCVIGLLFRFRIITVLFSKSTWHHSYWTDIRGRKTVTRRRLITSSTTINPLSAISYEILTPDWWISEILCSDW